MRLMLLLIVVIVPMTLSTLAFAADKEMKTDIQSSAHTGQNVPVAESDPPFIQNESVTPNIPDNALEEFAQSYASSRGYRFGSGANVMMTSMGRQAVIEIKQLPPDLQAQRLSEAKINIMRFIDEMIKESKKIPNYSIGNPGVIGEQTFTKAWQKLCPIWPICR